MAGHAPAPAPTGDALVCEMFVAARSLPGVAKPARRARAEYALGERYRSLLAQPAQIARSRACRYLLDFAEAASPESVHADELVLDFVTCAVWHADDHARPLALLARAFGWRLRPLVLSLGLHVHEPTPRAVDVFKWLLAHTRPDCADELALSLVPTLQRFASALLRGRDRSRATALELLGEVALRAPQLADALAPFFWQALLLDTTAIKEQAAAIAFDVLFVLLARGALAEGCAARADGRGFGPMLALLPRLLLAPSALLQRTAAAGVARLVWHAGSDAAFEAAVVAASGDDCVCDELLLQLVARYVDARPGPGGQGAHAGGGGGRLADADDRDVLRDLDGALSAIDEGLLADCAVFVVVRAIGAGQVAPDSERGFGEEHVQLRRALHELVRRLSRRELRDGLAESIGSTCLDLFGADLDPERVRGWLGMAPGGGGGRD